MKTLRRFLYREILTSVGFATLAFLALFFLFDLMDELRWVGRSGGGYTISRAVLFVALGLPQHLYELLPITVLIGTIFVMARLAQSSEFTILRTSGLGPGRALGTLLLLGSAFVALTFAIGDYIAPASERAAQLVGARHLGQLTTGATGAWLKERQGEHSRAINVRGLDPEARMHGIRVFEFDEHGQVAATITADTGAFSEDGEAWLLHGVRRSLFERTAEDRILVQRSVDAELRWPTRITASMVSAAVLKPDKMPTVELFRYVRHLEANGQSAQRYEIEFWRKVFYPLSCLVMVVLSLPFAYLHFRSGGIAGYVFGGVMAGISFFMLNNVFGFAGNLQNWSPWLTAAAPGLIYTALSLAAFGWLVLRR